MAVLTYQFVLFGQPIQGIEIPVGSSVTWILDVEDPTTREPVDLGVVGRQLQQTFTELDVFGNPVLPEIFSHQASIPGIPINRGVVVWTPGDTIPDDVPLPPGQYFLDTWLTNPDGSRFQTLTQAIIKLTAAATLPGTLPTPSPPTQPLGVGPPGIIDVIPRTIRQPADSNDFRVTLNNPVTSTYAVQPVPVSDDYTGFSIPDGNGDRTPTDFRVKTAGALPDGAVVEFFVFRTGL